jgi:hypothetical protein
MERPKEGCTDKEYSKWYWSDFTAQCKSCKNKCKQSHVIIQVICNKFDKVN